MAELVDFEQVLELFESNGWKLKRINKPYRIFEKEGEPLPWPIEVHNKKVKVYYVKKFKEYLENKG